MPSLPARIDNRVKYSYELYHPECGKVALYMAKPSFTSTKRLNVEDFQLRDGSKPKEGKPLRCGACGKKPIVSNRLVRRRFDLG